MTSKQKIFLIVVVMLFIGIVDNFYIGFRMRNHMDDQRTDDIPYYWTAIKNNDSFIELYGDSKEVKYALLNIDNDTIPEMVLADDDTHSASVSIFKYDVNSNQIKYINSIGSNAGFWYINGGNKLFAEYGNQGIYDEVSYSIVGYDMICNAAIVKDNNRDTYYTGVETSDNLKNENLTYYTLADFDLKEVSESIYESDFSEKTNADYINYKVMKYLD